MKAEEPTLRTAGMHLSAVEKRKVLSTPSDVQKPTLEASSSSSSSSQRLPGQQQGIHAASSTSGEQQSSSAGPADEVTCSDTFPKLSPAERRRVLQKMLATVLVGRWVRQQQRQLRPEGLTAAEEAEDAPSSLLAEDSPSRPKSRLSFMENPTLQRATVFAGLLRRHEELYSEAPATADEATSSELPRSARARINACWEAYKEASRGPAGAPFFTEPPPDNLASSAAASVVRAVEALSPGGRTSCSHPLLAPTDAWLTSYRNALQAQSGVDSVWHHPAPTHYELAD